MSASKLANDFQSDLAELLDKHFPLETICDAPIDRECLPLLRFEGTYIFCAGSVPIYIGVSGNVGERLVSHLRNTSESSFAESVTKIKIIRFASWDMAADLEADLINLLHPRFNKASGALQSYLNHYRGWTAKDARVANETISRLKKEILALFQADFHTRIHDEMKEIR